MRNDEAMAKALQKLRWIAKLSKKTLPGGVPGDAERMRALLNRIVLDVRAACGVLEKAQGAVLSDKSDLSDRSDKRERLDPYGIADARPEVAANTLLCLINQATYLLKRQIERLEQGFVEKGGFTEKLYRVRSQRRKQQ